MISHNSIVPNSAITLNATQWKTSHDNDMNFYVQNYYNLMLMFFDPFRYKFITINVLDVFLNTYLCDAFVCILPTFCQ